MPADDLYPRLAINLDEDTDLQIEAILGPALIDEVAQHADVPQDGEQRGVLRDGLRRAFEAYVDACSEREGQRSEKEDNRALNRVAKAAGQLEAALLDLQEFPGVEARLERSIRNRPTPLAHSESLDLPKLIGTRRNIFADIRDMLIDLQVYGEDAVNREPHPVWIGAVESGESAFRFDSDEELEERRKAWRARSNERKFPKDHAIQEFLRTFRPTWDALSPHPFTHGMYHKDAKQTVSRLVDASHLSLQKIDGAVTRQAITTAVRKLV
ncbi:hypothetical protein SAMN04488020_12013 [Palleronia marisminoris]|uniref:Uncharacterized protein n=1 Tax=Palleronia marisminoris TaxID=315423 RepID=A0A1Y5TSS5_9RHOB|nr:hypothetical protein [Palleronia marisminoris]SFH52608.1 hypothetical protein SAMN04488020_12013 [Palleronia marisminoris]SLN71606.1 hypothetical protein PAM7066_03673 [Palleronia marisminoris]